VNTLKKQIAEIEARPEITPYDILGDDDVSYVEHGYSDAQSYAQALCDEYADMHGETISDSLVDQVTELLQYMQEALDTEAAWEKKVTTLKKQIAEIEARPEITPKKKKNGGSPTKRIKK
jgi:hypothetical protein